MVYAGAYRLRGTLAAGSADRTNTYREWALLPLQAAEIDSQLPGGKLTRLQVPWLLLNSGWIHGIALA